MCAGMALTTRRSLSSGGITEPFLGAKLPPAIGWGKRAIHAGLLDHPPRFSVLLNGGDAKDIRVVRVSAGWIETAAVALAERLAAEAGTDYEGGQQIIM